jgi:hypothetical protein
LRRIKVARERKPRDVTFMTGLSTRSPPSTRLFMETF